MKGQGSYIIGSCDPAMVPLMLRINAIKRAAEEYPGIELAQLVDYGQDMVPAVGFIENAYTANPDVTCIIGTDAFSEVIGNFIASNNLKGKVYGAGFDLSEGILKHISDGNMQGTVGQNPFLQGYHGVMQCYQYIAHGYAPLDIMTGFDLVTPENVANASPE
jgi:ABC-type sugar transport system substrate-binding protein